MTGSNNPAITTIAFDADDTLWINETIFTDTRRRFEKILADYINVTSLKDELYDVERRNLHLFGYGIKGFMLSMIESAIELTDGKVSGIDIQRIIDLGKEMLAHPVRLLPEVASTVKSLKEHYQIMIITKGDLFDQESKIARSGIAQHFKWIEIVSEKDEASYQDVINKYTIDITSFLMVGNSMKSDVLPICNLGGKAVHIPFHETWQHEDVDEIEKANCEYKELDGISALPAYLSKISD